MRARTAAPLLAAFTIGVKPNTCTKSQMELATVSFTNLSLSLSSVMIFSN